MIKHYILNEDKEVVAVPFEEWVTNFNDLNRRVDSSWIKRKPFKKGNPKMLRKINKLREKIMHVSTVFLGLDHRFDPWDGSGEPIIFETMVFWDGDFVGMYQRRYCTHAKALVGHKETVDKFSKPINYSKYI